MNNYQSYPSAQGRNERMESSGSTGRTWGVLVLGLVIGMMGAQIFVTRPLAKQMELLQKQVQATNRDIELLAGLRDQWTVASDLAVALAQSRSEIDDGWKALEGVRLLRSELALEAARCRSAIGSLGEVRDLRNQVAAIQGSAAQQVAGLVVMNRAVKEISRTSCELSREVRTLEQARRQVAEVGRFAEEIDRQRLGIDQAKQTLGSLIQFKNDLLRSGHDIEFSKRRADSMLEIVDRLRGEKANAVPALENLGQLEKLRDRLQEKDVRLTGAIETVDLLTSFQKAMTSEARRLGELRRSLSDIEAISESTRRIIESLSPAARFYDLRELNDVDLRSAARAILEMREVESSPLVPAGAKLVE